MRLGVSETREEPPTRMEVVRSRADRTVAIAIFLSLFFFFWFSLTADAQWKPPLPDFIVDEVDDEAVGVLARAKGREKDF